MLTKIFQIDEVMIINLKLLDKDQELMRNNREKY